MIKPFQLLGKSRNRGGFSVVFNVPIIHDNSFDTCILNKFNLTARRDIAFAETERAAAGGFPHFFGDLLVQNFVPLRRQAPQAVKGAADFCDALQQAVSVFGRHGIKFFHPLFAVEVFDGA